MRVVRREQQSNNDDVVKDRGSWSRKDYSAMNYKLTVDYKNYASVFIGNPTIVYQFFSALRWKDECKTVCYSNGKAKLDDIIISPEPLNSLLNGSLTKHKQFIRDIRYYNNAFQMTSSRSKEVVHKGFMPTFKVQGQVYHVAGSIFPYRNNGPMGGCTVLFSEDFHQILPVVARGTRADEVNVSLKRSYLWSYIKILELKTNMRVLCTDQDNINVVKDLLLIGNGEFQATND